MCSRACSGVSDAAVPADHGGHLELEVEQLRAGRDRDVVVRADQRVRVGEVERRRLVPLRHHARAVADRLPTTPSTCSSNATKSRTVGAASGGSSRTPSSGTGRAASAAAPGLQRGGQPRADQVEHGDARAARACSPASPTTPGVRRSPPVLARWRTASDRRGDEQALVRVVERLRARRTRSSRWRCPTGRTTSGWVKSYRCGCQVSSSIMLQLGGVLDGVAVRVEEVAEGVVAGQVPARAPDLLHPGPQQPAGAAHVLVDAAQLEATRGAATGAGRGRWPGCGARR